MSKWVKASDLGLFARLKPGVGLPGWAIQPERYEIPLRMPARVDQLLYDREIESIMRVGAPTDLEVLRSQTARGGGGYIAIRLREALRVEMFEEDPLCFWCRKAMVLDPKTNITCSGKEKGNDLYASFEHLKPRSLGGRFTRDNIRLAHAGCNRKRHTKWHLDRYAHDPYRGVKVTI